MPHATSFAVLAGFLVVYPGAAQAKPAVPEAPAARPAVTKPLLEADRDFYFTNVAPAVDAPESDRQVGAADARAQARRGAADHARAKHNTGYPPAARRSRAARRWPRRRA